MKRTVSPERANFVLSSDIPYGEVNVLVCHSLHVEACIAEHETGSINEPQWHQLRTDGRDGRYDFSELQLVENGCRHMSEEVVIN